MVSGLILGKDTTLTVKERSPEAKAPPQEFRASTTADAMMPQPTRALNDTPPPRFYRRIEPFWWIGAVVVGTGGWWLLVQAWG